MPLNYARRLTGPHRTREANAHLGVVLAFVAGATNAGGFLAIQQYTSHMTGIVSAMADHVALGAHALVLPGLGAVLSFVAGAMASAALVLFARRRQLASEYALPLLLEAALLLGFGLAGASLQRFDGLVVPLTVMLLAFIMGLQNALTSKISRAEIRTTHLTGTVTDIGIELGRLLYWRRGGRGGGDGQADLGRLALLSALAGSFFLGAVAGALGFQRAGYLSTVPLALVLVALASVPALDDVVRVTRRRG